MQSFLDFSVVAILRRDLYHGAGSEMLNVMAFDYDLGASDALVHLDLMATEAIRISVKFISLQTIGRATIGIAYQIFT